MVLQAYVLTYIELLVLSPSRVDPGVDRVPSLVKIESSAQDSSDSLIELKCVGDTLAWLPELGSGHPS